MKLQRKAQLHQAGVETEVWSEFRVGDRVLTREGILGTVVAVEEGFGAGAESYIVELDAGLGGGEYGPGEVSAVTNGVVGGFSDDFRLAVTDDQTGVQYAYGDPQMNDGQPVPAGQGQTPYGSGNPYGPSDSTKTPAPADATDQAPDDEMVRYASDDYPMLIDILVERPPLAHAGSKTAGQFPEGSPAANVNIYKGGIPIAQWFGDAEPSFVLADGSYGWVYEDDEPTGFWFGAIEYANGDQPGDIWADSKEEAKQEVVKALLAYEGRKTALFGFGEDSDVIEYDDVGGINYKVWGHYDPARDSAFMGGHQVECPLCGMNRKFEGTNAMRSWMEIHATDSEMFGCRALSNVASKTAYSERCAVCGEKAEWWGSEGTAFCSIHWRCDECKTPYSRLTDLTNSEGQVWFDCPNCGNEQSETRPYGTPSYGSKTARYTVEDIDGQVVAGPFVSRADAEAAERQAREEGQSNLVIKRASKTADGWFLDKVVFPFAEDVSSRQPEDIRYDFETGKGASYDWCRFRRTRRCFYPEQLDKAATAEAGYNVWIPFDRGFCPYEQWEGEHGQRNCPMSEPGPNAGAPDRPLADATISWKDGGQRYDENGLPVRQSVKASKSEGELAAIGVEVATNALAMERGNPPESPNFAEMVRSFGVGDDQFEKAIGYAHEAYWEILRMGR